MAQWFHDNWRFSGSVLFTQPKPPAVEDYDELKAHGFAVRPLPNVSHAHWVLELEHPHIGQATLVALEHMPPPPVDAIEHDGLLFPNDKQRFMRARSCVTVHCQGQTGHVLTDAKRFLRLLKAAMLNDGIGAMDHASERCWSADALNEELVHDADCDIDALFAVHATRSPDGRKVLWLHTHGLADAGGFDVDILNPSPNFLASGSDYLRAMAHAILEETVTPDDRRFLLADPDGRVRLVDVPQFQQLGGGYENIIREDPDASHVEDRVVLCEPTGVLRMSRRAKPCEWLSNEAYADKVVRFSPTARRLMADRAIRTYDTLCLMTGELADFDLPIAAKIQSAQRKRSNGTGEMGPTVWCDIHELYDGEFEATIVDEHDAQYATRQRFSLDRLADWMVMTPFGTITPRTLPVIRDIRQHRDDFAEAMGLASGSGTNADHLAHDQVGEAQVGEIFGVDRTPPNTASLEPAIDVSDLSQQTRPTRHRTRQV